MTVVELGQWLVDNGFSEDIRQRFESNLIVSLAYGITDGLPFAGEEMDGEAVFGAFGCQVGPDCLKDILPTYGQRIKVYRAIKAAIDMIHCNEVSNHISTAYNSMLPFWFSLKRLVVYHLLVCPR